LVAIGRNAIWIVTGNLGNNFTLDGSVPLGQVEASFSRRLKRTCRQNRDG